MPTESGDPESDIKVAADGGNPTEAHQKTDEKGDAKKDQPIGDAEAEDADEPAGGEGHKGNHQGK